MVSIQSRLRGESRQTKSQHLMGVCVWVCTYAVQVFDFFFFFFVFYWTDSWNTPGMFSLCGRVVVCVCVCVCMFLQARARWRHQARFVRSREEVIRQPRNRWVHLWTWWASPAGGVWADRLPQRPLRPSRPPTSQPSDPGAGTLCGARNVISPTFFSPRNPCCFTLVDRIASNALQLSTFLAFYSTCRMLWHTLHSPCSYRDNAGHSISCSIVEWQQDEWM